MRAKRWLASVPLPPSRVLLALLTAVTLVAACGEREPPLVCPEQPAAVADCANGFCAVPKGCFTQGPDAADPCGAEGVRRVVVLTHALSVQQHEVRRESYRTLTGEDPWSAEGPGLDELPAEVTWNQAAAYCNALSRAENLPECYTCGPKTVEGVSITTCDHGDTAAFLGCRGYRLPTEAEWEYAARANTQTALYSGQLAYCGGADPRADRIAWYRENSGLSRHDVGGKEPNGWGLHDTAGNAAEWVQDTLIAAFAEAAQVVAKSQGDLQAIQDAVFATERAEYLYRATGAVDPLPPPSGYVRSWLTRLQKGGDASSDVELIRPSAVGQRYDAGQRAGFRCVRSRY